MPTIQKTIFSEVVIKIFGPFSTASPNSYFALSYFSISIFFIFPLSFFNFLPTKNTLVLPDLLDPSYCMAVKYNDGRVYRLLTKMFALLQNTTLENHLQLIYVLVIQKVLYIFVRWHGHQEMEIEEI